MVQPLRVLFYDDAPDFGGHELQALAAIRHIVLQPDVEVGFIYFRGNARLGKQIAEIAAQHPRFKPHPQDYASGRFQVFRTLLSIRAMRKIAAQMASFKPDLVVMVQGAIAFCSAGLLAAKWAGLHSISYIPMTHPESMFSESRLRAALREPVNRFYYGMPDEYFTISPRMETYLRARKLRQPVTVVPAAIDLTHWHAVDKGAARAQLGLSTGDWVVALIGRVQFWQKRQDLAVRGLALARQRAPHLKLLLVGDGPDLGALKALVRAEGLEDAVVFAGWSDNLSQVYSAIDALVIPSRYEGLPLVLLQAMYLRLPVIASAVDGMVDTLPQHWLFSSGDASALATRLVEAVSADESALLDAHREMVVQRFSMPVFERAFMAALKSAKGRVGRGPASPQ